MSPLVPSGKCQYYLSKGHEFLNVNHPVRPSPTTVPYRNRRLFALEGMLKITCCLMGPDVMRFMHDSLYGIGIILLAIYSPTVVRCRAVTMVVVEQQPILRFDIYAVYKYIPITSEHQSTHSVSPVLFNWSSE